MSKRLSEVRKALGLMSSMITGGEGHSTASKEQLHKAWAELEEAEVEDEDAFPNPLQILLGYGRVSIQSFEDEEDKAAGIYFRQEPEVHEVGSLAPPETEPHYPEKGEIYIRCDNRAAAMTLMSQVCNVVSSMNVFEFEEAKNE